ncbi:D-aminoacylase [Pelomonas sp. SE-A7]|uniref:N-acyl-D-amino-acid deacylase family protein n=1 Tax=Pelomonas sp. SE-A7 TaxID=3054953 RepID=UPI00259D0C37|nr:D-aminoacylase [Pelomonas sp. SE-A7]MDM4765383.1 D-aminoacylase [Pelomonas sp. SE-A7]
MKSPAYRRLLAPLFLAGLLVACAGPATPPQLQPPEFDLLIRGGRIVDGSGNAWYRADLAVKDGRIAAIGPLAGAKARRVIEARDRIVAPGFIDTHGHIEGGLFERPTADNFVQDGVTTVVTGNCGSSEDKGIQSFFEQMGKVGGTSINVASLVGHNTVRRQVMGLARRAATAEEQQRMEALVDQAMREGAVGLSTGLIYLPGLYSDTPEVVGLAKAAARHHGVYASHIRDEASKVVEAINEALDIGRQAGLPVQISHFKVGAPANWGRSKETLALIEKARADGLDVTIDQYPYTASSTQLTVMLPDWAVEGGQEQIRLRLQDAPTRQRIAADILASARRGKRPDFSYAVVARHGADASLNGRNISQINLQRGRPATMESEIETLLDIVQAGGAQMTFHGMSEEDVKRIMAYPFAMVGADSGVQNGKGHPHPRGYGTNARVLGKYVREEQVMRLEEAVRRMTSLAAQRFSLKDRGLLRPGYAADIVVFDDKTVKDRATFESPHQFSEGFEAVVVNGVLTVEAGKHSGARAGKGLKQGG